jgi:hypothetical protein
MLLLTGAGNDTRGVSTAARAAVIGPLLSLARSPGARGSRDRRDARWRGANVACGTGVTCGMGAMHYENAGCAENTSLHGEYGLRARKCRVRA